MSPKGMRACFAVGFSAVRIVAMGITLMVGARVFAAPPNDDVVLVRVKYSVDSSAANRQNDWNAKGFAKVLFNVSEAISRATSVDVAKDPVTLTFEDPELPSYPFLLMTGHFGATLNENEVMSAREYLTKGGVLLATACCGNSSFSTSFEREMKKVFPEKDLITLPPGHDMYGVFHEVKDVVCFVGSNNSEANKTIERTPLKGIEIDGRTVVIFSPYALTCGWTRRQSCGDNCQRIEPEDAYSIAINALIYALTH